MAKPKNPKGIKPLKKQEAAYYRAIKNDILNPLMAGLTNRLKSIPPIMRAYENAISAEFAIMQTAIDEKIGLEIAGTALDNIRHFQKAEMIKAFQAALKLDINPFMSDLNIRPIMRAALQENLALIKSIPEELKGRLIGNVSNIFQTTGFDQEAIFKTLKNDFNYSKNRARFISRDQTSKIIGNLNEQRQTDMGIDSYIWQTSEDERVVGNPSGEYPDPTPGHGNHYERNGKKFLWAVPPPDGHPGAAYNCRCVAVPFIPETQEEINEAA